MVLHLKPLVYKLKLAYQNVEQNAIVNQQTKWDQRTYSNGLFVMAVPYMHFFSYFEYISRESV